MTVNVEEIHDFKEMLPENQDKILQDMENCEFVLNYFYKHPKAHAIYVESYNVKKKWLKCVNSNGETDQYPRVPIKDILNLYRVTCTAVMDKRENYGDGAPHDDLVSVLCLCLHTMDLCLILFPQPSGCLPGCFH